MTRIQLSGCGSSPFERLIGHNAVILEKWSELESVLFTRTQLGKDLLEQVRRTMAFANGCEYCMVKAGRPDFGSEDRRASVATAFAQMFAHDHRDITDQHFDLLREEFGEQEISELCSFISFINACQKLGSIYHLTEEHQVHQAR